MKNIQIAVILSGAGVFDGSEIHEAVFSLLAVKEQGATYQCFAPDMEQYHVINHITGEEMKETRNVMVEAARIARGNILPLTDYQPGEYDGMIIPGGFGAAKNLTTWAFSGPDGEIREDVKNAIQQTIDAGKPITALCMGPTVIAKALEGKNRGEYLTVGSTEEKSPYDIAGISAGMEKTGAIAEMKTIREITVDEKNKIITAPCYMMEADILEVRNNIKQAVERMFGMM